MQADQPQPMPEGAARMPREVQRCVRCHDEFEAIKGVMPLCWKCCKEEPLPILKEREILMATRSWQAVLDYRKDRVQQVRKDEKERTYHDKPSS